MELTIEQKQRISQTIAYHYSNYKLYDYNFIFENSIMKNIHYLNNLIFKGLNDEEFSKQYRYANARNYKLIKNPEIRLAIINEHFDNLDITDKFHINKFKGILLSNIFDYITEYNIINDNTLFYILVYSPTKEITIFKNDISESDIVKFKENKLSKEIDNRLDSIGKELYNEVLAQL